MEHANKLVKATGEELFNIIPQRPPFVFIDTFYEPEGNEFFSGYNVAADNPLVHKGLLQESGLFENIAQTAAAGNGYQALLKNTAPPVGYIGAIKRSELIALPSVNDTLYTTVNIVSELMNASVIEGVVYCKGKKLIQCQMHIFLNDSK